MGGLVGETLPTSISMHEMREKQSKMRFRFQRDESRG